MQTDSNHTPASRRKAWPRVAGWAALAVVAWGLSTSPAHARGGHDDVYWSIGVSSPGVSVGVSNAPPVVVQTRPVVIHQPAPVVVHQPYAYWPYSHVRPVVVHPYPLIYGGYGPRWDDRHHRRHWKHKHHRHDHDRWDDDDDRRGGRH